MIDTSGNYFMERTVMSLVKMGILISRLKQLSEDGKGIKDVLISS